MLWECYRKTMWRCGGRVKVILIKSCSLDLNAILVTIFLGRALLTFNTAEMVMWEGCAFPLGFSEILKKVREWEADTWWPEEEETFLHAVPFSCRQPLWHGFLRICSTPPCFLKFHSRNVGNSFCTQSNHRHIQKLFGSHPGSTDIR